MGFAEDLETVGFAFQSAGRGGVRHYALPANRFLTYYCHVDGNGAGAVFSFEFALGEFCLARGLRVGANEVLNVFLYADQDVRIPPSVDAVIARIEATETLLNSLRLADPGI